MPCSGCGKRKKKYVVKSPDGRERILWTSQQAEKIAKAIKGAYVIERSA